ncbi:MAG: FtsX-like permease family protein [Micrococcales bacterium]|nr:FtsX-like permease family protein [Micrococcales bacterium]
MLKASWKSFLARKLRLFMSAIAIVLGVGFVAGSLIFTDGLSRTFTGISEGGVGDVHVRPAGASGGEDSLVSATVPGSLLSQVRGLKGVAQADGNVMDFATFVIGENGKPIGGQGPPGIAVNYSDAPSMTGQRIFRLVDGRVPTKAGEVMLDTNTARRAGYSIGETVPFVVSVGDQPRQSGTLVGTMEFGQGGMAGASLVVLDTASAQRIFHGGKDVYNDLQLTAADGVSADELRATVAAALPSGYEAVTGAKVADETKGEFETMLSFINTFLLVFGGVSLFVGSFLIINTFSILVAQRSRELAMFRAIGAKRGQVTRSVLLEALVVGLIGATLGTFFGLVLAQGIKVLFKSFGLDMSGTPLTLSLRTALIAYAVGIIVTLIAAYLPARRAGQVAPVAAMRDDVAMAEGSLHGRVVVGAVVMALGALGMGLGLFTDVGERMWLIGAGIFGLVLGTAMTSPVVGRPFLAVLGAAYRRMFGSVGHMAAENSVRNPRRTAATASALMIGTTLVAMMAVIGASTTTSLDKQIKEQFAADYLVGNLVGTGFSPAITQQIAAVDGVDVVSPLRFAPVQIEGKRDYVTAIDPATFGRVTPVTMVEGRLTDLGTDEILVPDTKRSMAKVGATVPVTFGSKQIQAKVAGVYEENPSLSGYLFSTKTFDAAGLVPLDNRVFIVADEGADTAALKAGVEKVLEPLPTVTIKDQADFAEQQRGQIDQMLYMIYALLGLAVIIAVLGIINTLALSVIERTREIGLLRAVGLKRRQLSQMIRLESVAIALLGAVLGLGLGVACGIAVQRAMVDEGITELAIPWLGIIGAVVLAAVVGVLAAVWPARRGARLDVLEAIQTA